MTKDYNTKSKDQFEAQTLEQSEAKTLEQSEAKTLEQFEAKIDVMIEAQKELFHSEILEFKEIGHKLLRGDITSNEFKASSGGMGVYAQKGGKEFMIRLRVLSGVLDIKTLELIHDFAIDYNLQDVHLTTREAIQLHNLAFDDVISIMTKSLDSNLYTRGGGGNFPRNVSLSPLSGVAAGEAFDVTPYALAVNKYFLSGMNHYKLPRKFKVAFSNNQEDTANATIADLGFLAVNQDGKHQFKVFIGGGLGNQGAIAVPFDELVAPEEILYHIKAGLQVFTEEGDYENKGKARMRYIVKRLGSEEFLNRYRSALDKVKQSEHLEYSAEPIIEHFVAHTSTDIQDNDYNIASHQNLIPQKQSGLYTAIVHAKGGILKVQDLNQLITFLRGIPNAQLRLSMEENLYIRNLTLSQANELVTLIGPLGQTTKLERSISCIGVPICQIGIGESQKLLNDILTYFEQKGMTEDLLPSIQISGCLNSCSRHQVSEIGLQCKKKQVPNQSSEIYSLHIGGMTGEFDTNLGKIYGDISADTIPAFLYELALRLKERQVNFKEYRVVYQEEFEALVGKYLV